MERLTKQWGTNPAVPCKFDLDFVMALDNKTMDGLQAIFDRLAAYEDTGLEPEEIEEIRGEMITCYDESGIAYHVSADGSEAKHIVDLLMAESQGRLMVLPCKEFYEKIGDFLYLIDGGEIIEVLHGGTEIDVNGKTTIIVIAEDDIFPWREPIAGFDTDPTDWCVNTKVVTSDDFGKTVFLTREEAEAALKGGTV